MIFFLLFSMKLFAGYEGDVAFTQSQISEHYQALPRIMEVSSACLKRDYQKHLKFYKKWGISPYFGDNSSFAKLNSAGKKEYLKKYGRYSEEQIQYFLGVLEPTSCVGLTLKCLQEGFHSAGQQQVWKKLKTFTVQNGVTGGALMVGLQNLGWKLAYWNPDTSKNEAWDANEQKVYPGNPKKIWGFHALNWKIVNSKRKYLYNQVDDVSSLVNFGKRVPKIMEKVPFFVGIAHMGYHVFPGSYGWVIEGHSTRQLHDSQTIESSAFSPLSNGGGPRGNYRSGLIAIPPGY
jgi:hypothetical protein